MLIQSWDQFWQALMTALIPVLIAGLLFLAKKAFSFIETKTEAIKNDQLRSGLRAAENEAYDLTNTIVASLNQTVVQNLKAQNGNTLSPADAVRIRADALNKIKSLLSDEATRVLVDHKNDIEAYLGHLLESTVGDKKSSTISMIAQPLNQIA